MNNKNIKRCLIIILLIVEVFTLSLTCKSFFNKPMNEVVQTNKVNRKQFSVYVETEKEDGTTTYKEYKESNLFPTGYRINLEESKCIDAKGNIVDNILSDNIDKITITSGKTAYCYLYFDKIETAVEYILANASETELWDSTLEDDGYRYVGTNPDNYVCFGYSDADTDCDFTVAENTDKYAYRVIGIFEDNNGVEHVKLIKKEALNTKYAWNEDVLSDIVYLYDRINGDTFLTNETYMPNGWNNKIVTWEYTITNTLTSENNGLNYYTETVQNIYLHEMNRSSKTSTIGEWETASRKVGLMYVSDYLLSLGSSTLSYTAYSNKATLKTGWMGLVNNDTSAPTVYEWTMTRYGADVDSYYAWLVIANGSVLSYDVHYTYSARPVFYLKHNTTMSGDGTLENPFIVS